MKLVELDAGLDPDSERLGRCNRLHEPGQVQQQLDGVAAPVAAEMEDPIPVADRFEHRQRALERLSVPAHVDRQRAGASADRLARDRRIEQGHAARARLLEELAARPPASWCSSSTTSAPGCSAAIAPSGPASTCSTSGGPGRLVIRISAPRAHSATESERAGTGGHGAGDRARRRRSKAVTSNPAAITWPHIGAPMFPSPMKPTRGHASEIQVVFSWV